VRFSGETTAVVSGTTGITDGQMGLVDGQMGLVDPSKGVVDGTTGFGSSLRRSIRSAIRFGSPTRR
jgi:hypothetical protein